MYSLDEINNKLIWLFREPRTGGTWISSVMSKKLNRTPVWAFTDTNNNSEFTSPITSDSLISTHNFIYGLPALKNYKDQIVIRTTRRNKTDILVSKYASRIMRDNSPGIIKNNIHTKIQMDHYLNNVLPIIKPSIIEQKEIDSFIGLQKEFDRVWKTYSPQYENETIYYEDVVTGWSSSILPITLSMTGDEDRKYRAPSKIPYDKRELILNYDEVDSILKNEFGE